MQTKTLLQLHNTVNLLASLSPLMSYIRRYLVPMPATRQVGWLGNHDNDDVPSAEPISNSLAALSSEVEEKSCEAVKEEGVACEGRGLSDDALVASQTIIDDPALHFSNPCAN